jgi:hypothetical protein
MTSENVMGSKTKNPSNAEQNSDFVCFKEQSILPSHLEQRFIFLSHVEHLIFNLK